MNSEKIRLLVLDDEEMMLKAFNRLMVTAQDRYEPEFFSKPEKALEAVKNNPGRYHVVLTDIRMPDMSGMEFVRAVRDCQPDLPIVFMTGFFSQEVKEQALSLKKVVFLEKPFQLLEVLNETIPQLLQKE